MIPVLDCATISMFSTRFAPLVLTVASFRRISGSSLSTCRWYRNLRSWRYDSVMRMKSSGMTMPRVVVQTGVDMIDAGHNGATPVTVTATMYTRARGIVNTRENRGFSRSAVTGFLTAETVRSRMSAWRRSASPRRSSAVKGLSWPSIRECTGRAGAVVRVRAAAAGARASRGLAPSSRRASMSSGDGGVVGDGRVVAVWDRSVVMPLWMMRKMTPNSGIPRYTVAYSWLSGPLPSEIMMMKMMSAARGRTTPKAMYSCAIRSRVSRTDSSRRRAFRWNSWVLVSRKLVRSPPVFTYDTKSSRRVANSSLGVTLRASWSAVVMSFPKYSMLFRMAWNSTATSPYVASSSASRSMMSTKCIPPWLWA